MFIPLDLKDVQERKPVPQAKYDLTVAEVDTEARTKEGKPQWIVSISIDGHEATAPNVRHYIGIPSEKDDRDQRAFKMLNIKRFNAVFGLPQEGLDSEAIVGARGNCELTISTPDDQGRTYNRLNLPYLKDDAAAPKAATPKPPKR